MNTNETIAKENQKRLGKEILRIPSALEKEAKNIKNLIAGRGNEVYENTVPCKCGNDKLIPNIYVGEPTLVSICCIECGKESEKSETIKKAIVLWNNLQNEENV